MGNILLMHLQQFDDKLIYALLFSILQGNICKLYSLIFLRCFVTKAHLQDNKR